MVIFLLLVIVAILLFGPAAILALLGGLLLLAIGTLAGTFTVIALQAVPEAVWWSIIAVVGAGIVLLLFMHQRQTRNLERHAAEERATVEAWLSRKAPNSTSASQQQFHSRAPTREERKRLREKHRRGSREG